MGRVLYQFNMSTMSLFAGINDEGVYELELLFTSGDSYSLGKYGGREELFKNFGNFLETYRNA